jgi:hypothetical protein
MTPTYSASNSTTQFRDKEYDGSSHCDVFVRYTRLSSDLGTNTGESTSEGLKDLSDDEFSIAVDEKEKMNKREYKTKW